MKLNSFFSEFDQSLFRKIYLATPFDRYKLYLATPLDRYRHPDYEKVSDLVRERFPSPIWERIEPARMGWNAWEWRTRWERLQEELDLLVVWPRPDRTIGGGCYTEIEAMLIRHKPVLIVCLERRDFYLLDWLELLDPDVIHPLRDWKFYARVYGRSLRAEEAEESVSALNPWQDSKE